MSTFSLRRFTRFQRWLKPGIIRIQYVYKHRVVQSPIALIRMLDPSFALGQARRRYVAPVCLHIDRCLPIPNQISPVMITWRKAHRLTNFASARGFIWWCGAFQRAHAMTLLKQTIGSLPLGRLAKGTRRHNCLPRNCETEVKTWQTKITPVRLCYIAIFSLGCKRTCHGTAHHGCTLMTTLTLSTRPVQAHRVNSGLAISSLVPCDVS